MKVLLMGPYPPPHGGVQTNLVAIRDFLQQRGIECPVINLTRYRRQDGGGVYYPRTPWDVLRLLRRLEYDVVHLHVGGNLSLRHAGIMLLCSLIPGKKTVFTFHSGGYPSSEAGRRAKPASIRGFVLRRLDTIIAVNQELVGLFRRFGVPAGRIRLILPYTVAVPAEDVPLPQYLQDFFGTHDPLLVTISGLEPEYDLPLQIEALGRLRRQFPRMGLAIIGGGSLESPIRRRIATQPFAAHILLCGDIAHETALRALSRSALFLRTTFYDGDSISVREALHLGIPVIATDNRMRPPGAHLIPISDCDALCRAVEDCLKAPPESRPPSPAGTENLEAVLRVYRELIDIP